MAEKSAGKEGADIGRIVELARTVALIVAVLMLPAGTVLRDWPVGCLESNLELTST